MVSSEEIIEALHLILDKYKRYLHFVKLSEHVTEIVADVSTDVDEVLMVISTDPPVIIREYIGEGCGSELLEAVEISSFDDLHRVIRPFLEELKKEIAKKNMSPVEEYLYSELPKWALDTTIYSREPLVLRVVYNGKQCKPVLYVFENEIGYTLLMGLQHGNVDTTSSRDIITSKPLEANLSKLHEILDRFKEMCQQCGVDKHDE